MNRSPLRRRRTRSEKLHSAKVKKLKGIRKVGKKVDADGFKREISKATGEQVEFAITPEAKSQRREEIYLAYGQKCGLCAKDLHPDRWEWHHKRHRSLGGDDSVCNGLPLCKYPANPFIGAISCHDLVHRTDLIEKKFVNDDETRTRYLAVARNEEAANE